MNAPDLGTPLVVVVDGRGDQPLLLHARVISTITDGVVVAWYEVERRSWSDMPLMLVDEGTTWARVGDDEKSLLAAYALLHSC